MLIPILVRILANKGVKKWQVNSSDHASSSLNVFLLVRPSAVMIINIAVHMEQNVTLRQEHVIVRESAFLTLMSWLQKKCTLNKM